MLWQANHNLFFDFFDRHVNEAVSSALLLEQLFQQPATARLITQSIKACEHNADEITHEIFKELNRCFILPFDREDIAALTTALDDVIDHIEDTSLSFTEIYCLQSSTPLAQQLTMTINAALKHLQSICACLRQQPCNSSAIFLSCRKIQDLESEGDRLKHEGLKNLYTSLKSQEMPIHLYLAWSEIYRTLETATDKIEDWANIAEQIAIKYS